MKKKKPVSARKTSDAKRTGHRVAKPEAPQTINLPPIFASHMVSPPGRGSYALPTQPHTEQLVVHTETIKTKTGDKAIATVDGFDNFVSRVGLNNNNALSAGVYEFNLMTRNRIQLEAAYRGSWVVGAVVDSVAEDMTRAGINVTTNEADEDIKDFMSAASRLQVWNAIQDGIKWARLYGGAIGVLQIEGQKLDSPLDLETVTEGSFKGLTIFDRWQLNPVLQDVIQSGPEMGLPKYYDIVTSSTSVEPDAKTSTGQIRVHHSRCIRFIGIELPFFQAITEMMWGESILERLWDRLIAFDNVTMSSASLVDRANLRTVGIDGLREIIAAGGQAQKGLEAQFEMMRLAQVNEGLTLLDKEDTFAATAYSFAGLSDMMLQFGQQLSGASGIPLVRLFGQSPAGLNSTGESDIRMYYDNINAQQESRLRRPVDVLCKVMWRSTFGKPAPKDFEFTFVPLWQMSAMDKAVIGKTKTETILGAFEAGLVSRGTAMKELRMSSGDTGLFSNITDEEIDQAEADEPPMPETGVTGFGLDPAGAGQSAGQNAVTNPALPNGAGTEGSEIDPTASLNGAQVTAMLTIVNQVGEGTIPRDTAIQMMKTAFGISDEQANAVLGSIGNGFTPEGAGKGESKGESKAGDLEETKKTGDAKRGLIKRVFGK